MCQIKGRELCSSEENEDENNFLSSFPLRAMFDGRGNGAAPRMRRSFAEIHYPHVESETEADGPENRFRVDLLEGFFFSREAIEGPAGKLKDGSRRLVIAPGGCHGRTCLTPSIEGVTLISSTSNLANVSVNTGVFFVAFVSCFVGTRTRM